MENVNKQLLDALKGVTLTQEEIDMGTTAGDEQHATARQAIAAAEQAQQAEPVAWEYREFHDDNTVTPGWGKWKRIESEEWAGRAIKSVIADIHEFIAQGYRYEIRALYAQPPAVPGAVDLLREMEWQHRPHDDQWHTPAGFYCPECLESQKVGHAADCKLAAVLAAAPQAAVPVCKTCNGKGMVGGLLPNGGGYDGEPCPDCAAQKGGQ